MHSNPARSSTGLEPDSTRTDFQEAVSSGNKGLENKYTRTGPVATVQYSSAALAHVKTLSSCSWVDSPKTSWGAPCAPDSFGHRSLYHSTGVWRPAAAEEEVPEAGTEGSLSCGHMATSTVKSCGVLWPRLQSKPVVSCGHACSEILCCPVATPAVKARGVLWPHLQ